MSLIKCPSCKRMVSEEASSCPQCGHPIKSIIQEIKKKEAEEAKKIKEAKRAKREKEAKEALIGCLGFIIFFILIIILISKLVSCSKERSEKEFSEKKPEIVRKIENLMDNKQYEQAIEIVDNYEKFGDSDLSKIKKEVEKLLLEKKENELYEIAKKIPYYDYEKNKEAYEKLMTLNPKNELYRQKYEHYTKAIERQNKEKTESDKNRACNNAKGAIEHGIVKIISNDRGFLYAYVDTYTWMNLTYEQKKSLILSTAYCYGSQYCEFKDNHSGAVVGKSSLYRVTIY